jgi:hypothetical protein
VQDVLGAGGCGQVAADRQVIRVDVRVHDVADPEPRRRCGAEVGFSLADGIDDRPHAMTAAAEEIRRGDHGIGMEILAQYHDRRPSRITG